MAQIEEITQAEYKVNIINSISERYGEVRQESKAPTFLL